ncbi:MAG: hypothetical protein K1X75_05520 [Leptospirales bacterium]|nr:hypothetical protein [Leptospirales bacterium]
MITLLPLFLALLPFVIATLHLALPGRDSLQGLLGRAGQWLYILSLALSSLFAVFVAPEALVWQGPQLHAIAGGWQLQPSFQLGGVSAIALLTLALSSGAVQCFLPEEASARKRAWHVALLTTQAGIGGAFLANSLSFFYVFFELSLIGVYFWIGLFGNQDSSEARSALTRFFIFTLLGSLTLLAALGAIFSVNGGDPGWRELPAIVAQMSPTARRWTMAGMLTAFLIKLPLFPLHGWMLAAYRGSPASARALLSGALSKLGAFGLLMMAPAFAGELREFASPMAALAAAGVLLGGVLALGSSSLRDTLIYASLSHLNLIALGVAVSFVTPASGASAAAAAYQMLNHGAVMAALFALEARCSEHAGALFANHRRLAAFFLTATLAAISLPGMGSFVAELTMLFEASKLSMPLTIVAFVGLLTGAMALMLQYHRRFLNSSPAAERSAAELSWPAGLAALGMAALWIYFGLQPADWLQYLEQAVQKTAMLHQTGLL